MCPYSALKASIGFILTARFAGINPANIPEIINMARHAMATVKFTSGFLINRPSPDSAAAANILFNPSKRSNPKNRPK